MIEKISDYLYDKMPGFMAIPCLFVVAVIFCLFMIVINIKRIHRPINEWN